MKLSASLFAGALLVLGLAAADHAQAADNAPTPTVNQPAASQNVQSAMVPSQPQQTTSDRSVVLGGNADQNDVTVRDPNVPRDPNRTFQGWWKTN